MRVEFRLLGEFEVLADGVSLDLGHTRQQLVLLSLAIEPNTPIPATRLVGTVWDANPPRGAQDTLYGYLSRLRKILDTRTGGEVTISRRSGGYVLSIDPTLVDLCRFQGLVRLAGRTSDNAEVLSHLDEALALWRGIPFGGLDLPWVNRLREGLEKQRFSADLDRNDLLLTRTFAGVLLPHLRELADRHPLNERVAGQLILALFRDGRTADALDHYERTRRRLADDLGSDPGHELRRIHRLIQSRDSAVRQADFSVRQKAIPRQLPPPPRSFVGRTQELAKLTETIASGGSVTIAGAGGVGKTWLALRWAHENLDRFPDGQLYVNLRGFGPASQIVPPAIAIQGFLSALGMDPSLSAADPEAQVGLYRSLLAGKRILVLADNAIDSSQVAPLLPAGAGCAAIVTSRRGLTELVSHHDAVPLTLDFLDTTTGRELLMRRLGPARLAAEPDATDELLVHCGGLPLALGLVAARATTQADLPLADLAMDLRRASDRLGVGDHDVNVRAVFATSLDALDAPTSDQFTLLGLMPGPDFSLHAAASLGAHTIEATECAFRELMGVHLLHRTGPTSYRLHDLVHLFAAEQAHARLSSKTRAAAIGRLLDFTVHTGKNADRLLMPTREPLQLPATVHPGVVLPELTDHHQALSWFEQEHTNFLALQQVALDLRWYEPVFHLAATVTPFHRMRGHLAASVASCRLRLTAAERAGDPLELSRSHRFLGLALVCTGVLDEGISQLEQALALALEHGTTETVAHTQHIFARAHELSGDDVRALEHARAGLELYTKAGRPTWIADALNAVGWYLARLGRYPEAREHCEQALEIQCEQGNSSGEAAARDSLAYIAKEEGAHELAIREYRRALGLNRDRGNSMAEADNLTRLGEAYRALGRLAEARAVWEQALDILAGQHRSDEATDLRIRLAALPASRAGA